jgi:hypothetical protein
MVEKHSALSSSQWSRDLKDFADNYSQSPEPTLITLTFEDMQGTSIDLSIEMDEKCAIGSEQNSKSQAHLYNSTLCWFGNQPV